jgi:dipeptidyl aminopeptidase/acylaminoacyl peptidase
MSLRQAPPIYISPLVPVPLSLGLVRCAIVLPADLAARTEEAQLEAILVHEMAHIIRRDPWLGLAQRMALVIFWWNPLVRRVSNQISTLREDLCDNYVVRAQGGGEHFARTLVDVASHITVHPRLPATVGVLEPDLDSLTERVHRLLGKERDMTTRMSFGSTIVVLTCGLILLLGTGLIRCLQAAEATTAPSAAAQTQKHDANPPTAGTPESDTIVGPKTGLKFTVAKKISGENDVVVDDERLSRSPDGRFLLYQDRVIPLDGSKAFKLEALHGVQNASWSPDGKLIGYYDKAAIWLLPVSPETGQPTGSARKLLDQLELSRRQISWSRDSQWIILSTYGISDHHPTAVSAQDGRPMQPLDYTLFSLRSPDQKSLVYCMPHNGAWTMPVQGGVSRLVAGFSSGRSQESAAVPLWWSPDGGWLLLGTGSCWSGTYDDLRFVRLADHREVALWLPQEVGRVGLGVSPDGKKLQFYKTSHEGRRAIKVAPIRGGDFAKVAFSDLVDGGLSSLDDRRWFFLRYKPGVAGKPGTPAPYVTASAAAEPVEMKLPEEVRREGSINWWSLGRWLLSPDGKRLFRRDEYHNPQGAMVDDFYVIPISLEKGESTGPATLIAKEWDSYSEIAWSPDSSCLAILSAPMGRGGLWIVVADGSPARQLMRSPEEAEWTDQGPGWSPDGKFIAFSYTMKSPGRVGLSTVNLYTIPTEGGVPKRLWTWTEQGGGDDRSYVWFPNGREIGLVSDGALVAIDIVDGSVRPILKLTEAGFTRLQWFQWSPDGQTLGLYGSKDGEAGKVALFHASDKKVEILPDPEPGEKYDLGWTRDSQAIFCGTWQYEKVRPAGLIYEVDLGEAWVWAKNSAGAESAPASASVVAKLEAPPLVDGQFRDDFEDGDTKYWTFPDEDDKYYKLVHEVQNGELVLENARAVLGLPEWTNYVVTVRMLIKQAPTTGLDVGIEFRMGKHGECYSLDFKPDDLSVGIRYWGVGVNNRFREGVLAEPPYDFVLDKWYTIQVEVKGPHIMVRVDGQSIIDLSDENCPQGAVALTAGMGTRVHFDDFSVRLLP